MIRRIRARLTRGRGSESGLGLAELVVAMGIFALLAVMIMSALSNITDVFARDRIATANTNTAAVAMDELTRVIRSATTIPQVNAEELPAFITANKEKLLFYAYIDTSSGTPAPVRVQFEVDASRNLVEKRWLAFPKVGNPTYWDFPALTATPATTKTIAYKIVAQTGTEAFMFNYQEINAALNPVDIVIPSGGIVATATLKKIAVVEVTVKVQTDTFSPVRALPVLITNQVGIPNLGVSRLALS